MVGKYVPTTNIKRHTNKKKKKQIGQRKAGCEQSQVRCVEHKTRGLFAARQQTGVFWLFPLPGPKTSCPNCLYTKRKCSPSTKLHIPFRRFTITIYSLHFTRGTACNDNAHCHRKHRLYIHFSYLFVYQLPAEYTPFAVVFQRSTQIYIVGWKRSRHIISCLTRNEFKM